MAEPVSTSVAASGALVKIFGFPVLIGSVAASLGFLAMWPKTKKEGFIRLLSTIMFSTVFGPALVIAVHSYAPGLFESAKAVAIMYDTEQAIGFLFIAAPIMVAAGLPAWWIIGAIVRWFDRRRGKDIAEMLDDATDSIKQAKAKL